MAEGLTLITFEEGTARAIEAAESGVQVLEAGLWDRNLKAARFSWITMPEEPHSAEIFEFLKRDGDFLSSDGAVGMESMNALGTLNSGLELQAVSREFFLGMFRRTIQTRSYDMSRHKFFDRLIFENQEGSRVLSGEVRQDFRKIALII